MRPEHYSPSDLTARARIRDSALAVIADRGVAGATVRSIAERSHVSPSLVLHHFGSKQGVVDEVSRWVIEIMRTETAAAPTSDDPATSTDERLARFDRILNDTPHLAAYLRRMLLDGQADGIAWFREAVATTADDIKIRESRGQARTSADRQAEAAMLVVLAFAPLIMQPLLEAALEVDFGTESDRARWRRAQRELLTSALYPPTPSRKVRR
jgi:TetR/AcrR family transcriptional regulator, regulator of cefoperazone and chloramphenicol sensitivity